MYRTPQFIIFCSAAFLTPSTVMAQDSLIGVRDPNGQSIKIGETDLVPSIRIDFQSTDNTFRTEDDGLDSERVIVSPTIDWFADRRLLKLKGTYEGSYSASSEDAPDFADHLFDFAVEAELNSKNRSRGNFSVASEHEEIGSGILSNILESDPNEVAEFTEIRLNLSHTYGASAARGNLTGGLRVQSRNYRNQSRITDGLNFVRLAPFAQFSYRVSADTRVLVGGRISAFTFDDDFNDRIDTTLFTGLNFSPTGKLSGFIQAGATQSAFDSSQRDDETSLFLDANLTYNPSNQALFQLNIRREIDNSRGSLVNSESAIDTNLTASWDHSWSSRISTRAAIEIEDFDAVCPQPSDVVTTPSFEIEYALRRWIAFGFNASHEQRVASSCSEMIAGNNPLFDYERSEFGVFVRGTL